MILNFNFIHPFKRLPLLVCPKCSFLVVALIVIHFFVATTVREAFVLSHLRSEIN